MAYLRDRRAFGNIGTRKFRGARFGDPLSPRFSGLLDQYPGAAAAYSLRALSSGWLAGDVVEVRRTPQNDAAQSFTASQITSGAMLDFVNGGTSDLYNNAMYFDGVDDSVTGVSLSISDGNSIEFMMVADSVAISPYALSDGSSSIRISSGYSVRIRVSAVNYTFGGGLSDGVKYKIKVTKSGGNVNVLVNDVSVGTQAIPDFAFDRVGTLGATYLKGTIYNIKENDVVKYIGDGAANSNWLDQIGGNNGTVNGTPAAYTGQPFDGFVSTWYDQSGNANNAVQATTTAQPKIVDAGALVVGGLDFDGVDDDLDLTTTIPASSGSLFTVLNLSTGKALQSLYGNVAGDKLFLPLAQSGNTANQPVIGATIASPFVNGSLATWTTREDVFSSIVTNTQRLVTMQGVSTTVDVARIGGGGGDDWYVDGTIEEIIIYPTDETANRVAIEANINAAYSIYV